MKRMIPLLLAILLLLAGCSAEEPCAIVATTAPVQQFAQAVCAGTGLEVGLIVSDSVSCLHDYTLSVRQMAAIERADVILMNGCGLEEFMEDALTGKENRIDCSVDAALICTHHEEEAEHHGHDHGDYDPHIWLDPDNAAAMTRTLARELSLYYPAYAAQFAQNAEDYCLRLAQLKEEGQAMLEELSCRSLVTFHDGFAYFAAAFSLEAAASIEEDSGSEASAKDLREITDLVREGGIPAVFVERSGSRSAASVIAAETDCAIGELDTVMSGEDYFTAMEQNLRAVLEALS